LNAGAEEGASTESRMAAQAQRRIIHVDMDAFYASVEQRDNPELRGKPIAVGGSRERGVVAAASYEARKFGVRSAMASVTAKRYCPELIFVKPRFDVYTEVSQEIRRVFAEHTPVIEPLSLDEAYLDVTDHLGGSTATEIAQTIRAKIRGRTQLTASAGVSYNKFLAKLASDQNKPDGLFVITPHMGPSFVETLPIGKFHGIGPATASRMNALGIHDGLSLRAHPLSFLQQHFGKAGSYYYWIARGIDERSVQSNRVRKSVGAENTFAADIFTLTGAREELVPILDKVWGHCERANIRGRTATLKIKYADFKLITRSHSKAAGISSQAELSALIYALLEPLFPPRKGIRLLGVSLSAFGSSDQKDDLFGMVTTQTSHLERS
jgi:DNA polymerase-4